jgi:catalase
MSLESTQLPRAPHFTLAEGAPLPRADTTAQIRNKQGGGLSLLQDTQLIETLAHFSRERIPERVVHAKAVGAHGFYEVTHDISDLTDADFLTGIGKRTELTARISTVGPERGSADTIRDVRGWAIKFKTAEGNQDWVFNDQPVFFVRDPIKFPSLNRSHKKHPATNASSADMFWDFHTANQEGMHALMFLFSDRGLPRTLRNINGYSNHTYKFTKADGSFHYVKIHLIADGGIATLTNSEATPLSATQPDYHALDLRSAIDSGNFPTWTVSVQVMHPKDVKDSPVNIFDMTKVWPHGKYPLRPIGRITYNRNPSNYFAEIEQAAFSPSTMVPGLAPSADPMLQARMFAYPDAARYRLGANYQFLSTNATKSGIWNPMQRDGAMNFTSNYGGEPNYVNSRISKMEYKGHASIATREDEAGAKSKVLEVTPLSQESDYLEYESHATTFTTEVTDEDFVQPRALWAVMAKQDGAQARFVDNVAAHVAEVELPWLREDVYTMFARVDGELGSAIKKAAEDKVGKAGELMPHKTAWH